MRERGNVKESYHELKKRCGLPLQSGVTSLCKSRLLKLKMIISLFIYPFVCSQSDSVCSFAGRRRVVLFTTGFRSSYKLSD